MEYRLLLRTSSKNALVPKTTAFHGRDFFSGSSADVEKANMEKASSPAASGAPVSGASSSVYFSFLYFFSITFDVRTSVSAFRADVMLETFRVG